MADRDRVERRGTSRDDEPRRRSDRDDEPRSRGRDDRDDDRGGRSRDRDDDRSSRRSRDDDGDSRRGRDSDDRGSSRGSGRSYTYERRDADATKRRGEMGANDYDRILKDGTKMFKPNDGINRLRILPPTWTKPKPDHFGYDIYVHYGVGADRGSYLCLHKMLGQPDPIHEEYVVAKAAVSRASDRDLKDAEKYAKDLEAKRRVLVYVIDRDHEKEGVQAWAMPWTVDRDIVKVMQDRQTGEVLGIDDPENGYDIEFEKKGSKDRTEYIGMAVARRSSPLGKSEWLEYAMDNPLPDQLQFFDYDHIAKAFGGGGEHRGDRDRDDDRDGGYRDRDNGGRSRDRDEGRDNGRTGHSSNSRDEPPARRAEPDEPTWESVHGMTYREMGDLIDDEKLDINPAEAKDDEDLADWICEELKIKKPEPKVERRSRDSDDESPSDRLRRMRETRKD